MTCIVGIEHDTGVTIGVDSATSDGWSINIQANSKLFRVSGYLFGITTSWRMGQLLQYRLEVGEPDTWDIDRFMATTFIDAVRTTLKDGGFARLKDTYSESGGTFLVATSGRLYAVFDDYQIAHASERYDAVGSGARAAIGSLHTTAQMQMTPRIRAQLALDAAAHHTPTVAPPFLFGVLASA